MWTLSFAVLTLLLSLQLVRVVEKGVNASVVWLVKGTLKERAVEARRTEEVMFARQFALQISLSGEGEE